MRKAGFTKDRPAHIMFCVADHFEPRWGNPSYATEFKRVNRWVEEYPKIAGQFKDADRERLHIYVESMLKNEATLKFLEEPR